MREVCFGIFQHTDQFVVGNSLLSVALDMPLTRIFLALTEQQRVMLLSRSPSGPKKYFPIPVENLEEEIRMRSADEGKLFREEFNVSPQTWSGRPRGEKLGRRGANRNPSNY